MSRRVNGPLLGALLALCTSLAPEGSLAQPSGSASPPNEPAQPKPIKGDGARASRAHELILELSTKEAHEELAKPEGDALLTLERALLAIYEGDCAEAATRLSDPILADVEEKSDLVVLARECELTMAGAVVREDADSGSWIRFQHSEDVALAPLFFEVVKSSRAVFERDLGVSMPYPIRIEVVRDQHGLSAMTGLPLSAARTTGTIGIAKWGRVVIVSPRATQDGYPVFDTLAHELVHLALTRGSRDRAPLWLQEGVARSMETSWRTASPFDHVPSADSVAAYGIAMSIGPDIDAIGPSIALLPSAEQAAVTYSKVESFMGFYGRRAGAGAMPKLLSALKEAGGDDVNQIIERVSGTSFSTWSEQWKAELAASAPSLSERDRPGAKPPKELKEVRQRYRLGELLLERGHAAAAVKELERGKELMGDEAPIRALLARALMTVGSTSDAKALVERSEDVHHNDSSWWSMRFALGVPDVDFAIRLAIMLAPYDPRAACEEKSAPVVPQDPARQALCTAARSKPRGR
jgi:hypothetical protein